MKRKLVQAKVWMHPCMIFKWIGATAQMDEINRLEPYFGNRFATDGIYDMPLIKRQPIDLVSLRLIRFSAIVKEETEDIDATVHFFEYDDRFDEVWKKPSAYLDELGQYKQVMSPDFSILPNMPLALQIFNTFKAWY